MIISHWLYPVQVLGPGNRLVLWVQGCNRRCKNCISPELQMFKGTEYDVSELTQICNTFISEFNLDGVTISGGEPFDQAEELFRFCEGLLCDDILVYTGYSWEEITYLFEDQIFRSGICALITNPYVDELNDNLPLRGSSNQKIYYLNPQKKDCYYRYLENTKREQQYFVDQDTVYMAGIPDKGQAEIIRNVIRNILEGEQ